MKFGANKFDKINSDRGSIGDNRNIFEENESNERIRATFNAMSDAVFLHPWMKKGFAPFEEVNDTACERYEYSHDEFLKLTAEDITKKQDAEFHGSKKFRENLLVGGRKIFETVHITKSGREFPVEINSTVLEIKGRKMLLAVVRDITERKRSEKALIEGEKKMMSIFRVAPTGIGVVKERVITEVNPRLCEIIGYNKDELIGRNSRFLYPSQEEYDFVGREKYRQIAEKGTGTVETRWRRKDGSIVEIILSSTPIDTSDQSKGVTFTALDITDRKQTLNALSKSESKYRSLIENSMDAIYLLYDRKFEIINDKFTEMFGYNFDEVSHKDFDFMKLVSPKSVPLIKSRISKFLRGEVLEPKYEFIALNKSGKEIICEVNTSYIDYKNGTATQGIIRDVTSRKKFEEDLRKLSRAVEQSPASVIITDTQGNIEYVNPKLIKSSGYSAEEVIGKNPRILKSGHTPPDEYKMLWETIRMGGTWRGEFLNKKKNGELYWELGSISPIKNSKGTITHFVAVKEDITKQKGMTLDLIKAKESAEKSDKLKTEFLAQISHEIRTPLNVMMSYTSLLKDEIFANKFQEYHEIFNGITDAGSRIIRTIDLILNAAELQAGAYKIAPRKLDLFNDTIVTIHNNLRRFAESKNLELRILNLAGKTLVTCDEYSLYQSIINLVDNAIKYTEKGYVEIRVINSPKKQLQVEIEDTGIGIAEEYIDHLFDTFSQEETGYTRRFEGTGLGLSLVKKYCDLNNITIDVKSKKNQGTKFSLTFNNRLTEKTDEF